MSKQYPLTVFLESPRSILLLIIIAIIMESPRYIIGIPQEEEDKAERTHIHTEHNTIPKYTHNTELIHCNLNWGGAASCGPQGRG